MTVDHLPQPIADLAELVDGAIHLRGRASDTRTRAGRDHRHR